MQGQPVRWRWDTTKNVGLKFINLNDIDGDGQTNDVDDDDDGDTVLDTDDVDDDNDGLIEVHDLDMFDHIRHNLAGTSYKAGSSVADNRTGAPEAATNDCKTATVDGGKSFYLCGYELTGNLDFAQASSYASNTVNDNWRPLDADNNAAAPNNAVNSGFVGTTDFNAIFEGNGHSISNLYSRGSGSRGLFRKTISTATIRNVGIENSNLYGVSDSDMVGSLVGWNQGNIIASHAHQRGSVRGGGTNDYVGGLVGLNSGRIIASYAKVSANGEDEDDQAGGLVGWNDSGTIIACYATGAVNGGAGDDDVGGLVGFSQNSTIVASYATGAVNGGRTDALVRENIGTITASYGFTGSTSTGAPGSRTVNGLDLSNAGSEWDDTNSNTKGAWNFGTSGQAPALKYADYDGAGSGTDYCALFPAKIPGTDDALTCGTSLLPEQRP